MGVTRLVSITQELTVSQTCFSYTISFAGPQQGCVTTYACTGYERLVVYHLSLDSTLSYVHDSYTMLALSDAISSSHSIPQVDFKKFGSLIRLVQQ